MGARFRALLTKFDSLSLRERLIVLGAGFVLIALSWYAMAGEPVVTERSRFQAELAVNGVQLADLEARLAQQRQQQHDRVDPNATLSELQLRKTAVQAEIQDYAAELISPTEMARVLERVLERRSALRLLRLRNFGAEDLLPEDSPGQARLYRHGLEIELEGPYLAVLAYLEDLEALPWRLYWQVLEIDTGLYPTNRIRIEVATLSLDQDWIGV